MPISKRLSNNRIFTIQFCLNIKWGCLCTYYNNNFYICSSMILIIDDDSAIRSSLSFMLKRAKYDVQAVPGPKEAIEIVRSVAPQLILMDMNFTLSTSGEEGLTLLKQVKVFRPDVPVILMTAWGSIQLAVQGMQAGAFDFITKASTN